MLDLKEGHPLYTIHGHKDSTLAARFSPAVSLKHAAVCFGLARSSQCGVARPLCVSVVVLAIWGNGELWTVQNARALASFF